MSTVGTVFDIKEFSIYDGPGVRVTVFLKGCPLRCKWCHNPEGLSTRPQAMLSSACENCGLCALPDCLLTGSKDAFFGASEKCVGCGRCLEKCPNGFRKLSGNRYTPEELKARLMKYEVFLSDGGVTFSGGEPTMQHEFLIEMLDILPFHRAIQTCGYCDPDIFKTILSKLDFLFFDIKHPDSATHKKYTGVGNERILENLENVKASGKPFIARVPLISGVNDGEENLRETARLLADAKNLQRVELLPFNGATGAKYGMVGRDFSEKFCAPKTVSLSAFDALGIPARVL